MTAIPSHGLRCFNSRPWLQTLRRRPSPRFFSPLSVSLSSSSPVEEDSEEAPSDATNPNDTTVDNADKEKRKNVSFFPKRGQTLELVCESLAFTGKGLCKVSDTGFVVMCDRALPGERFIGRVTRKKKNYAEVIKIKTISPHWDFVEAPCEHASDCGGCKTQNLSYEAQVRAKEEQVRDLVVHVGSFSDKDLECFDIMKPIIPCDTQFHYRNKMEFSFGTKTWLPGGPLQDKQSDAAGYVLGLHVPGFFDKFLNINKCLLQSEPANKVLKAIQECWRDPNLGLYPYDVHSHAGFLKHLMLRSGRDVNTGLPELMVNFVTSSYKPELLKPLVEKISPILEVVSIVNNVNSSVGNTSVGEDEYILHGKSTITETLRGLAFEISANSFFQTNTRQAEVLYGLIEEYADLKGDGSDIVLDLFCGTGTIGLTLARKARHVYGYEVVPQAISDARRNAKLNEIRNATFVQGDLNKIDVNFGKDFPKPDIIISDPNRPGMHMKLIKYLIKLQSPRIIYVSCNPATCARDLDYLCHGSVEHNIKGCYKLKRLRPVDMFPNTPHIECVCLLELQ
ncbi:uncharacterized protein LOC131299243 [Rhododendron vialii]|uniref:uncharacterized protein LOC131299243 n=1 Tax=Rhododendron vialii TaxID=182163 RepID=UPI00265ED72D|nr:uncharacterized protein LOC131299243 [Rhododendron vialii]XP_058180865.1 uncharacterized protein LOC131299243 [Rhododendron vialii]